MASAAPSIHVEEEFKCPICMEYLTDPMVLDCGHSFCQGCITSYCETWKELGDLVCPICKCKIQKGQFHRNWQLAHILEKRKLLPLKPEKEDLCKKHKERLLLFCKEDEELVCVLCERSPEHKRHTTVLLEEAARQHKDKILSHLESMKNKRKKTLAYKKNAATKSNVLLKRMELERENTVVQFRQLYQFLEEQEKLLLAKMEDLEKEIVSNRDECLARLSEEISSLESLIQEMEEKIQQPAVQVLQDVRRTLQRLPFSPKEPEMTLPKEKEFPTTEKSRFRQRLPSWLKSPVKKQRPKNTYPVEERHKDENPVAFLLEFDRQVSDICDKNGSLKGVMKKCQDTLVSLLSKEKANVTLDPNTASKNLIISENRRSIRCQREARDAPEEDYLNDCVLGCEGFTSGCHFWEVTVGREDCWAVGVAKKPVRGNVTFTPEEGIWAVGKENGKYLALMKGFGPPLPVSGELKRIRVCLNCDGGRVAFFDADAGTLLYAFSGVSFSGETLCPYFAVHDQGHLSLSSSDS